MLAIKAVAALCQSVGVPRETRYRQRRPAPQTAPRPQAPSPRALGPTLSPRHVRGT